MNMGPKRVGTEDFGDVFRSACTGMRGPNHPEERAERARAEGYEAGRRACRLSDHGEELMRLLDHFVGELHSDTARRLRREELRTWFAS